MPKSSKWFRIATEGASTDGRAVSREQIEQMAKNYSPSKYGARIWMEHLRGLYPDSDFRAYGDVVELKAEEVDGKLALFARLDPTESLVHMVNKLRQKVFTSIEIDPNFAKSGEAYLIGLGVTDSPALLGTEMLQFSSTAKVNPLSRYKMSPDNLFSEAVETLIEFDEEAEEESLGKKLFSKVVDMLKPATDAVRQDFAEFQKGAAEAIEAIASSQRDALDKFSAQEKAVTELKSKVEELSTALSKHQTDFSELRTQLEEQPDPKNPARPLSNGNGDIVKTDC